MRKVTDIREVLYLAGQFAAYTAWVAAKEVATNLFGPDVRWLELDMERGDGGEDDYDIQGVHGHGLQATYVNQGQRTFMGDRRYTLDFDLTTEWWLLTLQERDDPDDDDLADLALEMAQNHLSTQHYVYDLESPPPIPAVYVEDTPGP